MDARHGLAWALFSLCAACDDASPASGGAGAAGAQAGGGGASGKGSAGTSGSGGSTAGSGGAVAGSGGVAAGGEAGGGAGQGGSGAGAGGAGAGGAGEGPVTYGQSYEGGEFHLGPVDWAETQWHNACAPGTKYAPAVSQAEGELLAGLWGGVPGVAGYCDACIFVTTAKGKSALLRVVTYGDTTPNSIDVSPAAYQLLDSGEYPRLMTWQFARCPDTGKVMYEFQTGSSEWWTSLWVRNARVPLAKVEVKSPNHPDFFELERGPDGTLTDNGGFGNGEFSIRLTGVDGQQLTDTFPWPAAGVAGLLASGQGNFP